MFPDELDGGGGAGGEPEGGQGEKDRLGEAGPGKAASLQQRAVGAPHLGQVVYRQQHQAALRHLPQLYS